jgi:hypothetical protein
MDRARAIADAVLYEGYLLYPYRASATKNQVRWQWGVLMPPGYAAGGTGEYAESRTELLVEPGPQAVLHVRLRFLQVQARVVEVPDGTGYRPVRSLAAGGHEYTTFEEAVEREVETVLPFAGLATEARVPFGVPGGEDVEPVRDGGGARLVRRRCPLRGTLSLRADPLPGPFGGMRLRMTVQNVSPWHEPAATRAEALKHALVATHTLLSVSEGAFLSLLDPPEWAADAARDCRNEGSWPVLVGAPGQRETMLCAPIILYDYPEIAEQSPGELFDGTEIEEILTLRTMTLTEEEKRAARATDGRAGDLLDRVDNLPPEVLDRLHGTVRYLRAVTGETAGVAAAGRAAGDGLAGRRLGGGALGGGGPASAPEDITARPDVPWWDPGADASVSPQTDSVSIAGACVRRGSRVRLRPSRRADAQDMFLAGRTALVQAVLLDVDGDQHLAVTLEDDPAADLAAAHGRFRYFAPDEVEPLGAEEGPP